MPCSRAAIAATAGAFSFVTRKSGRTDIARAMNRRTDSYAVSASTSIVRAATGRLASSIEDSCERSGGVGQARHRVLLLAGDAEWRARRHEGRQAGRVPQELRDDRPSAEDLLEVVEHEEDVLVAEPLAERPRRRLRAPVSASPIAEAIRDATRPGSRTVSSATKNTPSG